ncbi:MAG TPA: aspartate/glutamate racemase family protein [Rubrivivax sp.]|nr:aspartate/glutamate racemase family protein [Rubrivivax sp.]
MPRIDPPGGEVDWPRHEGTLGVVGVAPWATLDFLRAFYARIPARKDWHYPRVIADINTKLPSRGRHLELGEADPSPWIAQTIAEMQEQGASVVVVPCNTAHLLFERWSQGHRVHLPHIVIETATALAELGARHVAALTSASLRQHGLYERVFDSMAMQTVELDDVEADLVARVIDAVKQGGCIPADLHSDVRVLFQRLKHDGVQGVALGCTELAALATAARSTGLVVSESNDALAAAALRLL